MSKTLPDKNLQKPEEEKDHEAHGTGYGGDNPKTHRDLGFGPSESFEVVMNRG